MTSKRKRRNPERVCFVCGCKITNRALNATLCKDCSRVSTDIRARIYALVIRDGLRERYKNYGMMIDVRLVKKKYEENKCNNKKYLRGLMV